MHVILLDKVRKLGQLGDKVKVKRGYARNYLIPFGFAAPATTITIADFETRRAALEATAAGKKELAQQQANKLTDLVITLSAHANDEGQLFGSITAHDIADAIAAQGVEVKKNQVSLATPSIRQLGQYEVVIRLHSDIEQTVSVSVVAAVA